MIDPWSSYSMNGLCCTDTLADDSLSTNVALREQITSEARRRWNFIVHSPQLVESFSGISASTLLDQHLSLPNFPGS